VRRPGEEVQAWRRREREREREDSAAHSRDRRPSWENSGGMTDAGHRTPLHAGSSEDLARLARAALAGSADDRETFLKACWQYAYAVAVRFGRKHHGSEDGAQDAVIAVHGLLTTTPPELRPATVGALVSVLVLRSAHAAAERRTRAAGAAEQTATARKAADPAHEVEAADWARAVSDVIDTLPQPLRRLIDLRYGDDMSTRAIARVVGVSQRTIMRLLREAETALKDKLRRLDMRDDRGSPPVDEAAR
jgi:RNA polymerase sigma factor (sigma-70 family)